MLLWHMILHHTCLPSPHLHTPLWNGVLAIEWGKWLMIALSECWQAGCSLVGLKDKKTFVLPYMFLASAHHRHGL